MQRSITGFFQDDAGQWVARLDCLHNQHTRHQPPFTERAWVTSEAGRRRAVGARLNCVRCDRMELPEGLRLRRRTPEWNEHDAPDALRSKHQTKAGVWGVIQVLEGEVLYNVLAPGGGEGEASGAGEVGDEGNADKTAAPRVLILRPGTPGIVVPELPHFVTPQPGARFCVEFYDAAGE